MDRQIKDIAFAVAILCILSAIVSAFLLGFLMDKDNADKSYDDGFSDCITQLNRTLTNLNNSANFLLAEIEHITTNGVGL